MPHVVRASLEDREVTLHVAERPDHGAQVSNVPGCRCDLCPLRTDRHHRQPIRDEVPPNAEVLFIGEAPGKNETERLRPMVGASGDELARYLASAGLGRREVGIANVLLCRPPMDLEDYLADIRERNADVVKALKEWGSGPGAPELIQDPRDCCRPRLMRYLAGRKSIIPLGGTALEAVTGLNRITLWRGSPLRVKRFDPPPEGCEGPIGSRLPERLDPHAPCLDVRETRAEDEAWVLPTMHPAYALHEGPGRAMRGVIEHDVGKALRINRNDRIQWTEPNFLLCPRSADEVVQALWRARAHALKRGCVVAVDIETDPMEDPLYTRIVLVGVSWGDDGTVVVPYERIDGAPWWGSAADGARIDDALRELLGDAKVKKVFHNFAFDVPILERHGFPIPPEAIEDTMVAHHAVCSELPHSLAFIATLYTDARAWKEAVKDGGKWKPPSDEVYALYCARDALTTWRIWENCMRAELTGQTRGARTPVDTTAVYEHGKEVTRKVLVPLRKNGMLYDRVEGARISVLLSEREAFTRDRMQGLLAGTDYASRMLARRELAKSGETKDRYLVQSERFHPGGMWAIRCALEALKIPIQDRTATGLLATGQDILAKAAPYADAAGRDFVRLLIGSAEGKAGKIEAMGWRACVKLRTTYLDEPPVLLDGRIHADWRLLTHTGRFSSSPNLQNWSAFMRSCFVPPDGCVYVGSDFCVAAGTRVATQAGAIPIESVRAGQHMAVQEDGVLAPIAAVISKGAQPIFSVRTKRGYVLRATSLHRVRVLDEDGEYRWCRIGDLRVGDKIAIQPTRGGGGSVGLPPLPDRGRLLDLRAPAAVDVPFAEWFGYVLGDGGVSKEDVHWVVAQPDRDVFEYMSRVFKEKFGRQIGWPREYRGVIEAKACSVALAAWLTSVGFTKERAPSFVWEAPDNVVGGFLRGLFEADASVGNYSEERVVDRRVTFSCKHEGLARDVQLLLLRLGVVSTRKRVTNAVSWKGEVKEHDAWLVELSRAWALDFEARIGFLSARKRRALALWVDGEAQNQSIRAMPNLSSRLRRLREEIPIPPRVRLLLQNVSTPCTSRSVTISVAWEVAEFAPQLYAALELWRLAEFETFFDEVAEVVSAGEEVVYDLSVPGVESYVSDGFVSHNSRVEWHVQALLSGDRALLTLFKEDDPHDVNARMIFGDRYVNAEKDLKKRLRRLAKAFVYGLCYGASDKTIWENLVTEWPDLQPREVSIVSKKLKKLYPTWFMWRDNLIDHVRTAGYLRSAIMGRVRYFLSGMLSTEILNTAAQSAAADAANVAAVWLADRFAIEPRVKLVNQSHDSLTYEAPEDKAEWVKGVIEEVMPGPYMINHNVPGYPIRLPVTFGVDVKIGKNWSEV